MRRVALTLVANGWFLVPGIASVGIVDRIFTRVGAAMTFDWSINVYG